MRLVRTEDEGVAWFDRRLPIFMARNSVTGDDVIELPLGAVGMIGISRFPRRNPANLDVEGMTFH